MLKLTPLHAIHKNLGARLIEFGGWDMPVQYTGIIDEHHAVRSAAGVFDISHMGEVFLRGPAAADFLNRTLTNDIARLQPGQGQYTIMCREDGGVVDDLYAYRLGAEEFLLVINASRIDADVPWLEKELAGYSRKGEVKMENASDQMGAVAVQGPRVAQFINSCFGARAGQPLLNTLKKNEIVRAPFHGIEVYASRTGYTGEDGFEIVAPAELIVALWNEILEIGRSYGLKPAGLGARDTLRTEVCYPLYGHELDEQTTPLEAGLGWVVALDKGDFVGRSVLAGQNASGVARRLIAFKTDAKTAPPRPHYAIWSGSQKIGQVTSGTQSPSLNCGIGMGYVTPDFSKPGTPIEIEVRGKRVPAAVVAKPIYHKPKKP